MAKKQSKEDNRLLLGTVRMPDVSNPSRDEVFKRRSAVSDDWEPSKELLDAIKSYEKFSPVVYKDGNGIETIGYGITDKKIIAKYRGGKRMSKREAERLFNRHVDDVIAQMKDSIPNFDAMSNNQKDAMTSYVYNVGIGGVTRKSPKLMEALENKNWKEAAKQMDFGYNDKNNSGLRRRRDEERALFTAYLDMGLEEPTEEELAAAHARMQQNALEDVLSSRNTLELQDPLRTDFNEAYRIAVKRKQPTFTWNGREFATDLKAEGGPTSPEEEQAIISRVNQSKADFIQRLLSGNSMYIPDWEKKGNISTHKLRAEIDEDGNAIVFPIVQNIDGKLYDFSDPANGRSFDNEDYVWRAMDNAISRGDTVRFNNIGEAIWFADNNYKKFYDLFQKPDGGPVAPRDAIQPPANPTMDFMNTIGNETPYYAGKLPEVVITMQLSPDEYRNAMRNAAARRGRNYVYQGQKESAPLIQGITGLASIAALGGAGVIQRVANPTMDAIDIIMNPTDPTSYLTGFGYIKDGAAKVNNLTKLKDVAQKADRTVSVKDNMDKIIEARNPDYNVVESIGPDNEITKEIRDRFKKEIVPIYKRNVKEDLENMDEQTRKAYNFINENTNELLTVNNVSDKTGVSPYAVSKAVFYRQRERSVENIDKMMDDPETFRFNISDNLGDGVSGLYKRSNDEVYIAQDMYNGDKEQLKEYLIHEFRHKFDMTGLSLDELKNRNMQDRINASEFTDFIDEAYQPTYDNGDFNQGSIREKIATNSQTRDKIMYLYYPRDKENVTVEDLDAIIDNLPDDEILQHLESTNAYGKEYAEGIRKSPDKDSKMMIVKYLLKRMPSFLPFGQSVDYGSENKDDDQMKDGGSVSPITTYKLESQELPTVEHIMDVVSDANRESMDPIADSIIEMGYVPYIRNYFKEGGANSDGILNDYFKKWNEWMKRPRASRRKNSFENASELTKIQNYYRREVEPSLKKKMADGGYTDDEIKELWGAFTPSGKTPGADSLDALMATIQEMRYNAFNASLNDIRLDENVRSAIDGTIRSMPPEDFLIMLRNTNGFGADYAKRLDKMPDSDEKDKELYRMRDIMARATSYAPIGLGAAYYNNASDEEVTRQMGGLVQHWGDRDWDPDEPKKTPEQIKAELDERYKITPDMPEADRLMMLNLRSFQEGGELSNEYKVKYLYDLLLNEAGMSQNQALAVLGNLWGESHWSESASGDTNTSYGIQQWHGDRRKKLIEFAKNRSGNEDPTFWDQAHFLVKEYKEGQGFLDDNSPVKLDGYVSYSKNDFQNAESLHDAVVAWNQGFGRPHKKVMRTEDRYKGALKAAEMLGITVDENMPSFYGINGISEDPIVPAFDNFAVTGAKPSAAPAATGVAQNTGEGDEDIPAVPGIENMTQEERQKLWFETYGKQMVEDYIAEENRVRKEQEDARRLQYQQQAEDQAKRDAEAAEQARRQAIIEQALDEAMLNIPGMAHGK